MTGKWAAIFDLDGVVVDTVPLHFKAWKQMFGQYGKKDFSFDDYKQKVDGIPRSDGARAILTDLSPEELAKACTVKQGYFKSLLDEGIPVYESTVKFIKDIRAKGIKTALISSSKNLSHIIKTVKLEDIWDAVVTGHEITKGKPDPQVFLTAAERLGMTGKPCVVFEDAVLGVQAAKAAKMGCVGIDRHGDHSRLKGKGADIVVSDLAEIDFDGVEKIALG